MDAPLTQTKSPQKQPRLYLDNGYDRYTPREKVRSRPQIQRENFTRPQEITFNHKWTLSFRYLVKNVDGKFRLKLDIEMKPQFDPSGVEWTFEKTQERTLVY